MSNQPTYTVVLPDVAALRGGSKFSHIAVVILPQTDCPSGWIQLLKSSFTLCKNACWRRKEALGGMAASLLGATQMTLPGRSCMTVHIQEGAVLLAYHDWISPWVCTIQRSQYLLGGCQGKAEALQDSWTRRLLGKYLLGRMRGAFFCAIE